MNENRQIVPIDYFFNNNLEYLQGGILTMTYTTSITKTKAAQYDLPGIEDMVLNIWMTRVEVMRKHGYGYLREIEVRRTDNEHHTFKEVDISRLRINDIEDMLIPVVQNRLINVSGNDVSDFAIALRMFTKSMVIQKRVKDLQLGVKSYQKKINITKPETTRPDIRNKDPYTPYQDPQGFIYVDHYKYKKVSVTTNIDSHSSYSTWTKNTIAEYMILSSADNRPPMLDNDLYDSWKSQMELYMQNKEHGRMILESVENGPLIWPTVKENGVIRTKKYTELSATEKIQADCDMKATNIILQGLPADIYSLVNHHRVAKDL
ncbi:hypothetical protein Tco_1266989 [Tanacetum coccineum]